VAVQVDVNDPAVMNLVLNNVSNVAQHYREVGEEVNIEVVAFGPGLHMSRDDTSPVKARIKSMAETMPQRHIPNSITTMRRRLSVALISQTDQRRRNGWHELAGHNRTMQLFMAFTCLEGFARTIGIEEDPDRIGRESPRGW